MLNKPIPITQHVLDDDTVQLVSISCLTYNHEKFIRDTIEGFLMQKTSFPVKIIIFEDCSTDNTANIIREYQTKHPKLFNIFLQAENTWKKPIRKKALEPFYNAHKAKYIALCEGDDYWTDPFKLQKQVEFLEKNEDYGLIYTDINKVDKNNTLFEKKTFTKNPLPISESFEDFLINSPFLAPCTWVIRASLIQKKEKTYVVGDLPMLLDIAAHSKIHKLEDTTANYRVLLNSASHFTNLKTTYSFMKGIYQIQMDFAQKYKVSQDVIEAIKIKHALISYNFAVAQHDVNQIKTADKLLKGHSDVNYRFKAIQLLSKFKIGREIVKFRLNRILGYA